MTVTSSLVTTTTIAISPICHSLSPPPPPLLLKSVFAYLSLHRSRDHHRHARNNHLFLRFNPSVVIIHKIYIQSLTQINLCYDSTSLDSTPSMSLNLFLFRPWWKLSIQPLIFFCAPVTGSLFVRLFLFCSDSYFYGDIFIWRGGCVSNEGNLKRHSYCRLREREDAERCSKFCLDD